MPWVQTSPGQWDWVGAGEPTGAPPGGGGGGDPWAAGAPGPGGGQPIPTGYPGTGGGRPRQTTGGVIYGFPPGSPGFQATSAAYWDKQGDFDKAIAGLRGGDPYGNQAGDVAMQFLTSPKGFDPAALQGRIAAATDLEAGSRASNLEALDRAAHARGFGSSMGKLDAASRLRSGSAANLHRSLNEIFYENERAKLQQQGIGAGLAGGRMNQGTSLLLALADMLAGRPRDVIPGISDKGGPGQSPWKYLNDQGQIAHSPAGGWTQAEWEAAMRERQLFEQMQGVPA